MRLKQLVQKEMNARRKSRSSDPGAAARSPANRKPKLEKRFSVQPPKPDLLTNSINEKLNINVAVRVRPLNEREKQLGDENLWNTTDNSISTSDNFDCEELSHSNASGLSYSFDHVFDESITTQVVYEQFALPVVKPCLQGYNGTLFAYGQTSAGKTHSVFGDPEKGQPGLTQLAVQEIFKFIRTTSDMECLLRLSYLELYNEQLKDLLEPENTSTLRIVEDKSRGVYVRGLKEVVVASEEEVVQIILLGESNRHFGCTKMNERSSRSHTVVMFILETRETLKTDHDDDSETEDESEEVESETKIEGGDKPPPPRRRSRDEDTVSTGRSDDEDCAPRFRAGDRPVKVSTLNLVDLAGSERGGKSGAKGEQLQEANAINKSLTVLGLVIMKLAKAQQNGNASTSAKHIPFRDSKLTRILSSSLGGNANTGILCCVSPARSNVSETQSTLDFATRAKKIVNHAVVNETVPTATLLHRYKSEIRKLKAQLAQLAMHGPPTTTAQGLLDHGMHPKTLTMQDDGHNHREAASRQRSKTEPEVGATPNDYLVRTRHRLLLKDLTTQFGASPTATQIETGNGVAEPSPGLEPIKPITQREHNLAKQLEDIQAEKDHIKERLLELQRSMFSPETAAAVAANLATCSSPINRSKVARLPKSPSRDHLPAAPASEPVLSNPPRHCRRRTSIDLGSLARWNPVDAGGEPAETLVSHEALDPLLSKKIAPRNEKKRRPSEPDASTLAASRGEVITPSPASPHPPAAVTPRLGESERSKVHRTAFRLLVALSRRENGDEKPFELEQIAQESSSSQVGGKRVVELHTTAPKGVQMHTQHPSTSWDMDTMGKLLTPNVLDELLVRVQEVDRLQTELGEARKEIESLKKDVQVTAAAAHEEKKNRLQVSKELFEVQTALEQMTDLVKSYVLNAEM